MAIFGFDHTGDPMHADNVSWDYVPPIQLSDGPDIKVPAGKGPIRTTFRLRRLRPQTDETNANGESQRWDYDAYGRLTAHTDLSGAQYHYDYDAASAS